MTEPQSTDRFLSCVRIISEAGDGELRAIEERIAALTREIDELAASRNAEIKSLRLVQRIIEAKQLRETNGRLKKRAKCQSVVADKTDLQKRIYDLLAAEGSMPVPAIAARLGGKGAGIGISVARCPWFETRGGEVHIAIRGS